MKAWLNFTLFLVLAASLSAAPLKSGARKGLLIEEFNAEFLVEADRTVSIAFYDAEGKSQPPQGQVLTLVAEAPGAKTKIAFEQKGDLLISKAPLPDGEGYQLVLQIRASQEVKPINFRFPLLLHVCSGCEHPEYACVCDE